MSGGEKGKSQKKLPLHLRRYFARLIVKLAAYILPKNDPLVVKDDVDERIAAWEGRVKLILYKKTSRCRDGMFVNLKRQLSDSSLVQTILPSQTDINALIRCTVGKYEKERNQCLTLSDLTRLMRYLESDVGVLKAKIDDRIEIFKMYFQVASKCEHCTKKLVILKSHIELFTTFGIPYDQKEVDELLGMLEDVLAQWENLKIKQDAVQIESFYQYLVGKKERIYFLAGKIIPKNSDGTACDVPSLATGIRIATKKNE
jgi:hypothetical protein